MSKRNTESVPEIHVHKRRKSKNPGVRVQLCSVLRSSYIFEIDLLLQLQPAISEQYIREEH